jgi:7-cyano-7-deazaguanine reductase
MITSLDDLKEQYLALEKQIETKPESIIDPSCLLVFPYEYLENNSVITIKTDEFSAVCPWTGLPDIGLLSIEYKPGTTCIELKSLKYYLLSYRSVGIVQEHAANRILGDLVNSCHPEWIQITLAYNVRGGMETTVVASQGV